MATANPDESGIAAIEQNREQIESFAERDERASYIAEALLEVADE